MGRKLEGAVPLWGRGAGSPTNSVAGAETYMHAKFHLDPSNRGHSAPTLRTDRTGQDSTDRQTDRHRSDSIGRTVLQTVAQQIQFWGSYTLTVAPMGVKFGVDEGNWYPPPRQISPPSVQRVAPAGRKTSKWASE